MSVRVCGKLLFFQLINSKLKTQNSKLLFVCVYLRNLRLTKGRLFGLFSLFGLYG